MKPKPIISTKRARKILGNYADKLSDEEVESLVENFEVMAEAILNEKDGSKFQLGLL